MKNNDYNLFIPVEDGFHLSLFDTKDERNQHQLVGFFVFNPAGMPDFDTFGAIPVVIWQGDRSGYRIVQDEKTPF